MMVHTDTTIKLINEQKKKTLNNLSHDMINMSQTPLRFSLNQAKLKSSIILAFATTIITCILAFGLLTLAPIVSCQQFGSFQDVSSIKPKLLLIVPQTFKVATRDGLVDDPATDNQAPIDNHVVIVNNFQSERAEQIVRKQFPRLVLQVRDANNPITGDLIYEHVFDYFNPEGANNRNYLLIPINLDQLSHLHSPPPSAQPSAAQKRTISNNNKNNKQQHVPPLIDGNKHQLQQLIVSIRPYKIESGFGSDNIELVSSLPIPIELVQSRDGRRSFGLIQTDKPIYKPSEKVRIRILIVNENLRPIASDEMRIQVRNPQKITVEQVRFPREADLQSWSGSHSTSNSINKQDTNRQFFFDHTFEFPPEPMLGTWSVHLLHRDPIANDTAFFEVREYTLPTFEILFELPKYVLPSSQMITGHIVARHHYGKPVQGKAQFKFGIRETTRSPIRWVARSNIKEIDSLSGKVEFRIMTEKIKSHDWFPSIAGSKFVIEASVIEMSTGHTELSQDSSCMFSSSPYKMSFENSIVDFRPGLSQTLVVQLQELQSGKSVPAGIKLEASYVDQNETKLNPVEMSLATGAETDHNGRAYFQIGPFINDSISWLTVTIKGVPNSNPAGDLGQLLPGEHHTLIRHNSPNGWLLLMNKTLTEARVGDLFESDLLIRDALDVANRIFYMVIARSQIIMMRPLDYDGFVRFQLTDQMVPRIRIVLFALTRDKTGLLSDSMRLNVNQDLGCGMSATFKAHESDDNNNKNSSTTYQPNTRGQLNIGARPGDLVSVTGVDSAIYTLHNKTRNESTRILERIKRLDLGCGFGGGRDYLDVFLNAGLMLFASDDDSRIGHQSQGRPMLPNTGSFCMTAENSFKQLEDIQLGYSRPAMTRFASQQLKSRMRRDTSRERRIVAIINKYREAKLRSCCKLGTFDDLPHQRNCTIRARIVQRHMSFLDSDEGESCSAAYLDCCRAASEELNLANVVPITPRLLEEPNESLIKSRKASEQMATPGLHYSEPLDILNVGHLDRIEAETLVRRDFRETWLFELAESDPRTGLARLDVSLPHSITGWSVTAMAVNPQKPMCFMQRPLKLTTFKEIFLQVTIPFKIVQGEQIDLVATVFNYGEEDLNVALYIYGVDGICSDAEPGERSLRRMIRLQRQSSQALIYPVIPLKVGRYPIKFLAISERSNISDILEHQLYVVPRGRPVSDEITFSLDPLNQQRRGKRAIQTGNLIDEIDSSQGLQRTQIKLSPRREADYIVPQTQECIVSAVGDRMGNTVQTTILDVENLIKLPHGCGEQVMIFLGPTLYTARYLSSINKLTGDIRWRAIRYIQSGYKRILNFRQESGAFSAFPGREPSIWLSAFVAKLLCQTERTIQIANELRVDQNVINSALKWLLEAQSQSSGDWLELNPVYHREMLGGVLKENALTAFVTITLNECIHHSSEVSEFESSTSSSNSINANSKPNKLIAAVHKAEEFLLLTKYRALKERNLYVLALTAYALSFARPREATGCLNELWRFAERNHAKNHLYWVGDYPIETAGYALSALIELAPIIAGKTNSSQVSQDAQGIANWLATRRSYTGAFESTQDTVVALEALSKLAQLQSSGALAFAVQPGINAALANPAHSLSSSSSLTCQVSIRNRTKKSIEFDKDNALILQTFKLDSERSQNNGDPNNLDGDILEVLTSGTGLGMMSVKLKYNVLQEEDEICHFNIDSHIEEWRDKIALQRKSPHSDLPATNSNNNINAGQETETGEEYVTHFSQPLLKELNLVYGIEQEYKQQPHKAHRLNPTTRQPILRLRRDPSVGELKNNIRNETSSENWASRLITNIKTRVGSWFSTSAKSQSATQPPARPSDWVLVGNSSTTPGAFNGATGLALASMRRASNTSRRATQNQAPPPPLIVKPTGIPNDAKFNNLSDKLELTSVGKTNDESAAQSRRPPSSSLINQLRVCVHHMSSRRDSDMAVIEIGILSGFQPNEADLKQIIEQPSSLAMKYELSNDKSLVVLYLRYIPSGVPFCLQFRQIRESHVRNLQSGYIRVYEYYTPTRACSAYYTPVRQTDALETRCDQSSQVCECASKSSCPGLSGKMRDLGEIQQVNSTSALNQLKDLVCSSKFDFVSLVQLRDVREIEAGRIFKITVKVKYDIRGNLSDIIDSQRQLGVKFANNMPKTLPLEEEDPTLSGGSSSSSLNNLETLTILLDSSCIRGDPLLLHLAHDKQWRKSVNVQPGWILFGRHSQLSRVPVKSTKKTINSNVYITPNRLTQQTHITNNSTKPTLDFANDSQDSQYSLRMRLDKDAILHDLNYGSELNPTLEAVKTLTNKLKILVHHGTWSCQQDQQVN